jgi:hypothetical protein
MAGKKAKLWLTYRLVLSQEEIHSIVKQAHFAAAPPNANRPAQFDNFRGMTTETEPAGETLFYD